MAIHVKDPKTDALVRRFAEMRGIGITEAIREAVQETMAADESAYKEPVEALRRRLQPLLDEMKSYKRSGASLDKKFFDDLWEDEGM